MLMRNLSNNTPGFTPVPVTSITVAVRDRFQRKQIVNITLLVIVLFQLIQLPGALMMHTAMDIGTVEIGRYGSPRLHPPLTLTLLICGLRLILSLSSIVYR